MAALASLAPLAAQAPLAPPAPLAPSGLAGTIADLAVAVLVDEATLAPKPGLVDARGNGAHADMSLPLMIASAHSLRDGFVQMVQAGRQASRIDVALRERLGALGRDAEAAMLRATGGVNTHRGAIWALGLLAGAAGWLGKTRGTVAHARAIAQMAAVIARLPDRHRPAHTGNKGELARAAFGVGGAREQAEAGFPHVMGDRKSVV